MKGNNVELLKSKNIHCTKNCSNILLLILISIIATAYCNEDKCVLGDNGYGIWRGKVVDLNDCLKSIPPSKLAAETFVNITEFYSQIYPFKAYVKQQFNENKFYADFDADFNQIKNKIKENRYSCDVEQISDFHKFYSQLMDQHTKYGPPLIYEEMAFVRTYSIKSKLVNGEQVFIFENVYDITAYRPYNQSIIKSINGISPLLYFYNLSVAYELFGQPANNLNYILKYNSYFAVQPAYINPNMNFETIEFENKKFVDCPPVAMSVPIHGRDHLMGVYNIKEEIRDVLLHQLAYLEHIYSSVFNDNNELFDYSHHDPLVSDYRNQIATHLSDNLDAIENDNMIYHNENFFGYFYIDSLYRYMQMILYEDRNLAKLVSSEVYIYNDPGKTPIFCMTNMRFTDTSKLKCCSSVPELTLIDGNRSKLKAINTTLGYSLIWRYKDIPVIKIRYFLLADISQFAEFLNTVKNFIEKKNANSIIIDVSSNIGGYEYLSYVLLNFLIPDWDERNQRNDDLVFGTIRFPKMKYLKGMLDYTATISFEEYFDLKKNPIELQDLEKTTEILKFGNENTPYTNEVYRRFAVDPEDSVKLGKKVKIAILTDGLCASTCSVFLDKMIQANAATVFSFGGIYNSILDSSSSTGSDLQPYDELRKFFELTTPQLPTTMPKLIATSYNYKRSSTNLREFTPVPAHYHIYNWDALSAVASNTIIPYEMEAQQANSLASLYETLRNYLKNH